MLLLSVSTDVMTENASTVETAKISVTFATKCMLFFCQNTNKNKPKFDIDRYSQ